MPHALQILLLEMFQCFFWLLLAFLLIFLGRL